MSLIKTQVIDSRNLLRGVTHIPYSKRKSNLEYSQQIDKDDPEELVNLIPESINLILSFRNIAHIENLTGLSNLQKLCLDNNDLSEINNLSHLINLKWLDLSFNRITKIEGLDQLYNLEDLSLYSNKIKSVEGLNSCTKLKCLSLGKNDISELSDLVSIKQLHSLRMLTLANNPLCRINNYKESICLLLPFIDYLDYRLVDIFERKNKYDECIDDEITKQTKLSSEPIHLDDDHFHYIDLALEVFFENGVNKKWIESKDPSVASVVNQLLVLKEKYREALKNLDQEFRDSCTRYKHESDTTASLVEEDRSALVAGYEQARLTVSKPIAERENKTTFAQWRESLIGLDKQFILVCDGLMELEQANIADSDKRFASHRSKAESHLELIISIYDDFISEINDIMGAHCVSDVHATSEAKTFDEEKSDDEGGQKAESELDSQIEMMTALNQIQEDFEVSMNRQINNSLVKERQRLHDFGREKILYIVNFSQTEKAAIDEWILHNEDDYFASKNKTFDTSILALNCDALHLVSAGQGSTSRSSDSRGSRKGSSRSSRGQLSSRKGTAGKSSARSTSRGPSTSRGNGASTHRSIK